MPNDDKNDNILSSWSQWKCEDLTWANANYVSVGIDVGSVYSKGVVMCDGNIDASLCLRTGSMNPESANRLYTGLLRLIDIPEERVDAVIGTGYGRVNIPMALRTVTEISCHIRGALFLYGSRVRTVLDVGGQDIKVIRCDERGKVSNFILNDKCAAGTGRGLEALAETMETPLHELGPLSLKAENTPAHFSTTCIYYLKNELTRRIRDGWAIEQLAAAACSFTAEHIESVVQRAGVEPHFVVTGGMANNPGIMQRINALEVHCELPKWDPQLAGAIGAAVYGQVLCQKGKAGKR